MNILIIFLAEWYWWINDADKNFEDGVTYMHMVI